MKRWLLILLFLTLPKLAWSHDLPTQLPTPQSPAEAWDILRQSTNNIDTLLDANLTRDVASQLANIALSLRYLDTPTRPIAESLLTDLPNLLQSSRDANDPVAKTRAAFADWRRTLAQLQSEYPTDVTSTEVYICPMHPQDRHLKPSDSCMLCGMSLVRRHLPASSVYQRPGQPTLKLTATCPPLVLNHPATITLHLANPDGSPTLLKDLNETHTKKIHLLVNDQSLSDYHHEHPTPTQTPGDYQFSFTPTRPGPYRVFADVVPAATGVQEYDPIDLPASSDPLPIADRDTRLSTIVDGKRFDLAIRTAGEPLKSHQTYVGTVSITTVADGQPFADLQPVMGAFAHLVGFGEDHKTILHIHPAGPEPTSPDARGGPVFAFKFYSPSAGFLRLYCQVRIHNADVFIPFNLTITN